MTGFMETPVMLKSPILILLTALPLLAQNGTSVGLGGGGALPATPGPCLSPIDHARVTANLASYQAAQPEIAGTATLPQALSYYPLAAIFREDMAISNYVDLDGDVGSILDYDCGTKTFDGHDASDALIRTFDEQVIGVPVFAVADGVVVGTHDGEPDMNTQALGQAANFVMIDHGGRVAFYWHLKMGSVLVTPGQQVLEGQEIGRCGASGNTFVPALHFAFTENGVPIEPFKGSCNTQPSFWMQQPPVPTQTVLYDVAVSRTVPNPGVPFSLPRDGEIALSDPVVYIWMHLADLPANTTWRFLFDQPNGTLDFDSGVGNFNNPQWGSAWFWFNWNVPNMHVITGTWTVRVEINGVQVAALPFEVVTTPTPGLNHPPEAVTVTMEPGEPSVNDTLRCRVTSSNLLDDLDFDVVSHRFLWRVNGVVVRDETVAARADLLPRSLFGVGDVVTCVVTPSDGTATGAPDTASVTISAGFPGSGDDLELRSGVDALPSLRPHVVDLQTSDPLLLRIFSPQGQQVGRPPVLLGQLFATGSPPTSPTGFPEFHLSPFQPLFVLFDGNVATPIGPILLPSGGLDLLFSIPPGLAGNSLMIQALTVTNTANNGFFAASNAKELRFL